MTERMHNWHHGRLAAFDIESTGVDPQNDRIVTATVSVVGGQQPLDSVSWLADPGIPIPDGAARVHGITTERAQAEGRPSAEVVAEIIEKLATEIVKGVPVVAFNARYDLTMLDREARRIGVAPLTERGAQLFVIDPLIIDKQLDKYRKGKRTLTAVCEVYNVSLSEDDAHAADADAIAAARVAWRLGEKFDELKGVGLTELHASQILWAAEQAESLEDYFRSQGKNETVEREWPIVSAG
ncbi:MAG: 3'-5' exonuclease [Thermoleophilaceae bacterium]|nr:3'-5' exonuclease [Thermoleophilaceae bacterium]